MKAIQIAAYGEPRAVLECNEIPEPSSVGPSEVLIGMELAPLDPSDLLMIRGLMPTRPELPTVVGTEGVGRVIAVGNAVDNVKVGDRVLPPLFSLTWRERLVVPALGLFALPADASVQQLAMLRVNPATAALLISEFTNLENGDWIVQNASNSGVGRSVIAIAKARGFRSINFVRRPEMIEELQAAGGDRPVGFRAAGRRSLVTTPPDRMDGLACPDSYLPARKEPSEHQPLRRSRSL